MDAGNFSAKISDFDRWAKSEFMWDMMGRLEYDAVTPGDLELLEGKEPILGFFSRNPQVAVVSANILDKDGNHVWPEYAIIEKGGVKFGVTGVTSPTFYSFNVTRGKQTKDEFDFQDSREALSRVLPKLQAESDVVVVLLHEGPGDARRIADEIEGIDVMVVGHNPGYMFNPDRVGNTLLLRPGDRGQYLSVLNLILDQDGEVLDYNGEGKPLGDGVEKDQEYTDIVVPWDEDYQARERADKRKKAAERSMLQGTEKYIGADKCARCHLQEYAAWSETAHAHAFQTLVADGSHTEGDCVSCHVVGYNEDSGFAALIETGADGKPQLTEDQHMLQGVQCESCHGMGTFHGTEAMNAKPNEDTCRNCHSGSFGGNFDYAKALAGGAVH